MRLSTVLRMGACALAMSGVALADAPKEAAEVKVAQAATPPAPASDAKSDRVEKVVVTAQKRAQALKDVPLPVQANQGSQLEQTGSNEISDLVTQIPGASAVSRTSPGFETISIRGISSGTTGDATTGYYIDDVAFGVPNLQLVPPARLFDLQRVEVLAGPQGTLFVASAMGGAVRYITNKADARDFHVGVNASYSLTVEDRRGPAAIDWYAVGQAGQGAPSMLGLIRRDGDVVRILGSSSAKQADRPKDWDAPPNGWWLMTLERIE